MNVDDTVLQAVLTEASKLITLQAAGQVSSAGQRLLAMFRRKRNVAVPDFARIQREMFAAAGEDPVWARALAEALLESTNQTVDAGPVPSWRSPMYPHRDRDGVMGEVPAGGVFVLAGRRGSGVTTTAQQIAHDRRGEYPGGVLGIEYARFRRADKEASTTEIQRYVLGWCGLDRDEQGDTAYEIEDQFRSRLATRRMLLVLLGVRDADEIEPFEPSSPWNLVLVTTNNLNDAIRARYRTALLAGMDDHGALQLLADKCGTEMVAAEEQAARDLLGICDFMPEPIQQVGGRLAGRREPEPIRAMVDKLREMGIADPGSAVDQSLRETIDELDPKIRAACLLLAGHPGFDFDTAGASSLLAMDAEKTVDALVDAGLLATTLPGRWRLHYAVRDYVLKIPADRESAFKRLLDFYCDCAVAADDEPTRLRVYPRGPDVIRPRSLPKNVTLIDYLDSNRETMRETARQAQERGYHTEVCRLGGALEVVLNKRGGYDWYAGLNEIVLASAKELVRETGDETSRAMLVRAHAMQGRMYFLLHIFDRAEAELRLASEALAGLKTAGPQLVSSLHEFWGRFHEVCAEQWRETRRRAERDGHNEDQARSREQPLFAEAISRFSQAVEIDRGSGDGRALVIHLRMLANVQIAVGGFDQAWPLLSEAESGADAHGRNLARIHMVQARAAVRSGQPRPARRWLDDARTLLVADGSTQYGWELGELEAELAEATGPAGQALKQWTELASRAYELNHPKMYRYFEEMERVRSLR